MPHRCVTILLVAAAACAHSYSPRLTRAADGWHPADAPFRIAPMKDGLAMPAVWKAMENTSRANDLGLQRAADTIYGGVVAWHYSPPLKPAVERMTPRELLDYLMNGANEKRKAEGETQPYDRPDNEGNAFRGEGTDAWERTSINAYRIKGGSYDGQIIEMRHYFAVIRSAKDGRIVVVSYVSPGAEFESGLVDAKDLARRITF